MTPPSSLNYEDLMHELRIDLVKKILTLTAQHGLIGTHHFTITVNTKDPLVSLPPFLLERFPDEMVIIIQHRFENLSVTDDGFSVTLFFQGQPENIIIPWSSVLIFQDPSVPFGLLISQSQNETPPPPSPKNIPKNSPKKTQERGQVIAFTPRHTHNKDKPSPPLKP